MLRGLRQAKFVFLLFCLGLQNSLCSKFNNLTRMYLCPLVCISFPWSAQCALLIFNSSSSLISGKLSSWCLCILFWSICLITYLDNPSYVGLFFFRISWSLYLFHFFSKCFNLLKVFPSHSLIILNPFFQVNNSSFSHWICSVVSFFICLAL